MSIEPLSLCSFTSIKRGLIKDFTQVNIPLHISVSNIGRRFFFFSTKEIMVVLYFLQNNELKIFQINYIMYQGLGYNYGIAGLLTLQFQLY